MEELTRDARIIARIQLYLQKHGWQWEERVFNDGDFRNCTLKITQNTGLDRIIHLPGEVGWGRFERIEAWDQAYTFVQHWGTVEAYKAAGSPRREDW